MYGGFAGVAAGSLLMIAGWASPNPAICVLQFVSTMGCGIGAGLLTAYGPGRALEKTWEFIRGGATAGDIVMRVISGLLTGLVVGPIAVVVTGFVVGGLGRMAPCHRAPDFIGGAIFGAAMFAAFLALPALAVGPLVGALVAVVLNRWQVSSGVIVLATTAVAFVPLLLWIFAFGV
jgi:hypothetical protein